MMFTLYLISDRVKNLINKVKARRKIKDLLAVSYNFLYEVATFKI